MPSAALLARASSGELEKTAEAIATDVLAETTAVPSAPESRYYRVRAGDSLYAIAKRTGTTVEQLRNWNKLRGSNLKIGTRLVIQPPRAANTQ
jgi:membrane-bound lytic murein transglycosylase D